ncbi:MAG: signal peptidase II, partial [Lachnospiraceae bacterium]|nr:signal peptidase II [Lachnospiraceae bacterium]
KKYSLMRVCVLFLAGGAIGNLIDRVFRGELFHGYVVDMIYVEIINFPVFNIADSFITVGFAVLIFSILFVYKEKDFDIIFKKKSADSIEESENIEETNENTADENAENKEADANAGNEEKSETDNVEEIIDESKEEKNSEETEKAESDDNKEET